ncbi:Sterol uptake control protein 2 [Colletotrichum trifolii]|uniref:Sterol uptake control protein 2 n=1 Tax=Colletotrichum trifolii TaxID=5466 RepID=A0A4R8RB73_COLTR|nr:Sterol uptake control protein 2 [Colletotrichum trifolii]
MNRRAHKKSRNGCIECKRRHIKCDETRPRCKNCTIIERDCVFRHPPPPPAAVPSEGPAGDAAETFGSDGPSTPSRSTGASPFGDGSRSHSLPPADSASHAAAGPRVNMDHMDFLVNFSLGLMIPELDGDLREQGTRITVKAALEAPYLMHAVLSNSARYFAHARPDRRKEYLEHAIQLQTEAVSLFNAARPELNESNCVAIAMFSSILGRHLCIDALATRNAGLDGFLDAYLNFARLRQRGASVVRSARAALEDSELKPFLTWGPGMLELKGQGHHFDSAHRLLRSSSNLDAAHALACARAVELAEVAYDSWEADGPAAGMKRVLEVVFTWAFLVPGEFLEMLEQRRPEAIAIMGNHAVVLHLARDLWQIGDSGEFLLRAVEEHLGDAGEEWLRWPHSFIFGTSQGSHGT